MGRPPTRSTLPRRGNPRISEGEVISEMDNQGEGKRGESEREREKGNKERERERG